jgi:hypothetical protein
MKERPIMIPTISMRPVEYPDGSFGVELILSGLVSMDQANAAMNHMQKLFCGEEIGVSS